MRRATARFRLFLTGFLCTCVIAGPVRAALKPGHLPLRAPDPSPAFTVSGEVVFDCGTHRASPHESEWRRDVNQRVQNDIKGGKRTQQMGLDYVYDDVWIVEDDGSLTFSGTNAFDSGVSTYLFTALGGDAYSIASTALAFDAVLGGVVNTGDDGSVTAGLLFSFPYAGTTWTQIYVGGNGAIGFGGPVNQLYYDPAEFYSATPKICPYYLDLDETAAGTVNVKSEAGQCVITWSGVREYGTLNVNTIQLTLFPSGNIRFTYNGIVSTTQANGFEIYAGIHPGGSPALETISYSAGLPASPAAGTAVYEAYFNYVNPMVNEVALFQRFYQQFPDDFFQLVFFTNFTQTMSGFANEYNIANDVDGINLGFFDNSATYGSSGALESRCNMNQLSVWPTDPELRFFSKGNNFLTIMAQEAGHRWGAFTYFNSGGGNSNLILGRSDAHWSYYTDVDHSSLEGGNWEPTGGSSYICPTRVDYFSELDEYLFGLRTADEVKDFFYISSGSNNAASARSVGTPVLNAVASGTFTPVTVEDVIAASGLRVPLEADEQKDLRQGFILLLAEGSVPSQQDLDKVAGFRRAWEDYFEKSCDGRLSCNTSLTETFDVAVVCGYVREKWTNVLIPEFTAHSLEREFDQHVPDDGRYIFRYAADALAGPTESVSIVFEADGYLPDTLEVSPAYGTTTKIDVELRVDPATAADDTPALKGELFANHPNPFNPSTTIRYRLARSGPVRVTVYDTAGRHVRNLVDATKAAGEHRVMFDGRDDAGRALSSGVYFYRLESGGTVQTRKMVLLK